MTVSILTRSEDRVLRDDFTHRVRAFLVSILTRSEDRVLPRCSAMLKTKRWFQSSPGPKTGCYATITMLRPSTLGFNPHPVRRPGATCNSTALVQSRLVSILTRSEDRVLRHRRLLLCRDQLVSILTRSEDRVLRPVQLPAHADIEFQSSPGPKTGCYEGGLRLVIGVLEVSILTRSEDRVLLRGLLDCGVRNNVSILTRSEDRVLQWRQR